ncbi:hypothetical protein [Nocardioides pacificus]
MQTPQCEVLRGGWSDEEHRQNLGELAEAGVDSFVLQLPVDSVGAVVEGLERYAADFR